MYDKRNNKYTALSYICYILFLILFVFAVKHWKTSLVVLAILLLCVGIIFLIVTLYKKHRDNLNFYKKRFTKLKPKGIRTYQNLLTSELYYAKTLSNITNNTTDIKLFTKSLNEILTVMQTLSLHEYTGWFTSPLPSEKVKEISENRYKTEILFIKRAFPENYKMRLKQKWRYKKYLKKFTPEAIVYYNTGYDCTIMPQNEQTPSSLPVADDQPEAVEAATPTELLEGSSFAEQPQSMDNTKTLSSSFEVTISNAIANLDSLDPLFREAGNLFISIEKASIGMLQRKFKIGFNRAERIMNQLAAAGVVGEEDGTKPRAVLMNQAQFDNLAHYLDSMTTTEREAFLQHIGVSYNSMKPSKSEPQPDPLLERIKAYNGKFDYMTSREFEFFCAELLKQDGFENIFVTSESRDQGVDMTADKDGIKYAILCKHNASGTNIGTRAVSEVFSGAAFYDCQVPVVLTSSHFTSTAEELAQKINVLLWDREYLVKLCIAYDEQTPSDDLPTDETDIDLREPELQDNNSI